MLTLTQLQYNDWNQEINIDTIINWSAELTCVSPVFPLWHFPIMIPSESHIAFSCGVSLHFL